MKKSLFKWISTLIISLLLGWFHLLYAADEVPIPELTNYVIDTTGTLNASEQSNLTSKLKAFEDETGSQIFVLMVPTVQPETIETYAVRAFEAWKVGRKKVDDGVLFVIAKNDRRNRIEVGYGLEGAIPDVTVSHILKNYVAPFFQRGDFAGGIDSAITQLMHLIKKEELPPPVASEDEFESWEEYIPLVMAGVVALLVHPLFGAIIFIGMGYSVLIAGIVFVVALIIRRLFGLPLFAVGSPSARRGRSSRRNPWDDFGGRGGGGFGGGFGGGGFGGGGFGGGGGGSSGGGGASGRW